MEVTKSTSRASSIIGRTVLTALLACAGYYAGGVIGLIARFPSTGISTIWPATAVLLAVLLLTRPRTWWLYLLPVLPVHLHLVTTFQGPVPLRVMLIQFGGNVAHATLAAWLLRRTVGVPLRLKDLRSMAAFIVLAAILSSWLVSGAVVYGFGLAGWAQDLSLAWRARSLSNGLGTLLVTPLLLGACTGSLRAARATRLWRTMESALLAASLLVVGIPILHWYEPASAYYPALPLALLPLLLWAAVRFGPSGLCFSLLLVSVLSLSGAMAGRGPFSGPSPVDSALNLQWVLFAVATPLMLLAALVQEKQHAARALELSETRYRTVVEDQTELICRFLADGTFTFVNGAYCRYFQRTSDELLGKTFWAFIPPDAHARARKHLSSLTPEHPVATIEHPVVAPAGEVRWQQWTDRAFFDQNGQIVDYQAVGRDITERKRAEEEHRQFEAQKQVAEALRQSESRLRQLADAMPQIVWAATPDGCVDYYNRKWYALTGADQGLTGDQSWLPVLHPDDRQRCLDSWYYAVRTRKPFQMELRFRFPTIGQYRWHLCRALPVRDPDGSVIRWYGTCTDVHDQKLIEDALRQSEARLRDANHAKDRFLAALSHELRTPLTPVLLAGDALRRDTSLPEQVRRDMEIIYTNATLEVALIDDLLDLTRVTRGKIVLHKTHVDVHALLEHTVFTCSDDVFLSKSLRIALELGADRHWTVGDSTRLSQVFWNLVKNAAKFSVPGGVITLRTHDTSMDCLAIDVIDTGFGIESADMVRIFDAFEQGPRDVTRRFGGVGLGLALCKAFVELHGGRISAHSQGRGRGATFRVELPTAAAPKVVRPSTPPPDADISAPSNARILLVEDHEFTAALLSRLLRLCGHHVLTANNVASATQAAYDNEFDLVISDLGLPDGTGLELMSHLARAHGLRGIALTGYGMEEDVQRSQAAGFVEHLVKPVNVEQVQAAISRVLSPAAVT